MLCDLHRDRPRKHHKLLFHGKWIQSRGGRDPCPGPSLAWAALSAHTLPKLSAHVGVLPSCVLTLFGSSTCRQVTDGIDAALDASERQCQTHECGSDCAKSAGCGWSTEQGHCTLVCASLPSAPVPCAGGRACPCPCPCTHGSRSRALVPCTTTAVVTNQKDAGRDTAACVDGMRVCL
jgi:hypothetical protein